MIFEGATIDDLKEHGTSVKAITMESEEHISINVFFEDEKGKRFQIAKQVDFVDIEGITRDNKIYDLNLAIIGEGKFYISDKVLYTETTEERFKTLTILIPIY